jgi:mannose-6-phosphate isomerase-like protein (cupin superfamily)
MDIKIDKQDLSQEFYTDEGCYITEVANSDNDPNVSIARARVEPGKTTRWHYLNDTSERYIVLQGEGEVELGDQPAYMVTVGDIVTIPAGERQRICNTGSEDLIFYCVCQPRFNTENYVDCNNE